ncbi:MAG TPA: VOC family protein [Jatrophihabitantaceae bacterium]|jgi:catechol 2,3-dioxygenase-like lactoylglutathione lyase family enzyme|nr:VOC family protein [Jatrophihabitantaceae bacterium]
MSTTEVANADRDSEVGKVDMKLEVQIVAVSDVDKSKSFYQQLGWRLDEDVAPLPGLRIVQFTPPNSGTSVTFGEGLTTAAPGSAEGALTVSDIVAAHEELVSRDIEVSDIWHGPPFPVEVRQPGVDPERASYGSFFSFTDPDSNLWLVQEVTTRRPGRTNPAGTAYVSVADLEGALRRAEAAHREHEKAQLTTPGKDWASWYATYLVAEQAGTDLPS